jgi:hypothetical protein
MKYAANTGPGQKVDLGFYKTLSPNQTVAKFQASGSEEKTVGSLGLAAVGAVYCHYGYFGGKGCDSVHDNFQCRTVPSGTWCGLAVTNGVNSVDGDSGGPWYNGSQAIGVHKGLVAAGDRMIFTMIQKVNDSLFVDVLQN